jgi:predicted nucleic acid-binding protein
LTLSVEHPALVVVDASVSLTWALDDEDHVDRAVSLRQAWIEGRCDLAAPSLWHYEIVNGLLVARRRRRLDPATCEAAVRLLMDLDLALADAPAEAVYHQASTWGLTAYDAACVALAEELQTDLWTGDRRLVDHLAGRLPQVRWIGDYAG